MKAVMISIRPKWVEKIASGLKTIEVRKTAPKLETPFKCYIYETKGQYITYQKGALTKYGYGRGKVIGEFVCDEIIVDEKGENQDIICENACLTRQELLAYEPRKIVYGWHISNLKIYDKPKEIGKFRKPCIDKYGYCQGCIHGLVTIPPDEEEYALYHGGNYEFFDTHCMNYLTRPPQSWCYVEI